MSVGWRGFTTGQTRFLPFTLPTFSLRILHRVLSSPPETHSEPAGPPLLSPGRGFGGSVKTDPGRLTALRVRALGSRWCPRHLRCWGPSEGSAARSG